MQRGWPRKIDLAANDPRQPKLSFAAKPKTRVGGWDSEAPTRMQTREPSTGSAAAMIINPVNFGGTFYGPVHCHFSGPTASPSLRAGAGGFATMAQAGLVAAHDTHWEGQGYMACAREV